MLKSIIAKGVRVHNLKNIDINIPLNKLTVITGVSGSGKSSLAFDTLYAEGQRRYVESFSAYARQFLERIDKPDVDHIEGIPAAIAMEQKNPVKNRRSTVGTATEVNDYLRLIFAKIGKLFCKKCGNPVKKDSVSDIVAKVSDLENGTKILIVFPVSTDQDIDNSIHLKGLKEKGVIRILTDRIIIDISRQSTQDHTLNITKTKSIFGVIDRITIKENIHDRLTDAVETAYSLGLGRVGIAFDGKPAEENNNSSRWNVEWKYSGHFMCSECEIEYPDPEPQLFSFNNPIGACEVCQGFGHTIEIDMNLVMPDKKKSIKEGVIAPWNTPKFLPFKKELMRAASKYKIPVNVPFNKINKEHVRLIKEGTDDFYGINEFFKKLETKKYKMHIRVLLSKYRAYKTCYSCSGTRLKKASLNVKINSFNIAEVCSMNIEKASDFFKTLTLNKYEKKVSRLILKEITKRLEYMVHVGLGYLTLDRLTRSLSGGESQRVNLTTSLGSSLVNTLYILDEPSIGLHARDTDRLIWTLTKLRDIGNTVIVVEHDKSIINASDNVIDIGPAAGEKGGRIVFQGTTKEIASNTGKQKKFDESLTVQYLQGKKKINVPDKRVKPTKKEICIKGAAQNNLKSIDVSFPLDLFICVTGVSGSGKSTLIHHTLYGAIKNEINGHNGFTGKYKSVSGAKHINDVILVDQSPIGRTPRSNPITYVKVFDEVRKLFAGTKQARVLNVGAGHFSFNVPGGRCDNCEGGGQEKIEMQFLADIYVICEFCQGKRFRKEILEIKYKEKNIYEVLSMTVDEASEFFEESKKILKGLRSLQDTGLGYLRLGQSATTLSGGEAQRLKLATFMAKKTTDRMLFIFDEPTTGLHFHDIRKLLKCFNSLVECGHSLIVIEHNIDVIKCSDYVIDLGPEGGDNGGQVIGCGTPEEIAEMENSYTGKYLKECLN